METSIKQLAKKYFNETVSIRQHLHQNPELSFQEYNTFKYITSKLKEYNIVFEQFTETGILGIIKGNNPDSKVIALRADIDALPIIEENDLPYNSINKGVMHACGHDVHTSILITVGRIINELKTTFEGTILLVFQPAEEKLPGGAKALLDAGIFNKIKPDLIIGQHVMPTIECGKVGFKEGQYMASADEIYLTIKGKGGHAAMPHQITDTVLIASQIIVALQQIVSRFTEVTIPTVLSFGKIIGNGATNVIPNEVKIDGTFRTMNEEWRAKAHEKITEIAENTAKALGARCNVEIIKGYPVLNNDIESTLKAKEIATNFLNKKNIINLDIRMTSEDFAFYAQKYPAVFYRLGVKNKDKGIIHPLHSSKFNIDENALETGVGLMCELALSFLK